MNPSPLATASPGARFEMLRSVDLVPFTVVPHPDDPESVVVGNEAHSAYLTTSPAGAELLEVLAKNPDVRALKTWARARHGEDVDLGPFLRSVQDAGLVRATNDEAILQEPPRGVRVLPKVRARHLRWLFGFPATLAAGAFVLWGLHAMATHPEARPSPDAIFVHASGVISMLISVALSLVLVLKHELGHLFAGRAFGIEGRIGVDRRLAYVVAVTDVTAAWTLPRWQRIVIYLAGIYTNVLAMSAAAILLAHGETWLAAHPLLAAVLRLIIFIEFAGILFQLLVHARTDFYYALSDGLGAPDLARDGWTALARVWDRLRGRVPRAAREPAHARERLAIRAFAVLSVLGFAFTYGLFAYALAFPVRERVTAALGDLARWGSGAGEGLLALDGAVFLALVSLSYGFVLFDLARSARRFLPGARSRIPGAARGDAGPARA